MNELKGKLDRVYQNIQNLEIQPSKRNTMLLADSFILLEEVFGALPNDPSGQEESKDAEEPEEEEPEADG